MPKKGADSKNDYRKYRSYYLDREASPQGVHKRVEREKGRRQAIKDGRLDGKHDPRTVDHVVPLAKGGGASKANTRIVSATANRRKYDH